MLSELVLPRATATLPATARQGAMAGQGGALTPASVAAETALAVRPVDPADQAHDVRAEVRRDLPVGPPPAFEINVLQHLREQQRGLQSEPDKSVSSEEADNSPHGRHLAPDGAYRPKSGKDQGVMTLDKTV